MATFKDFVYTSKHSKMLNQFEQILLANQFEKQYSYDNIYLGLINNIKDFVVYEKLLYNEGNEENFLKAVEMLKQCPIKQQLLNILNLPYNDEYKKYDLESTRMVFQEFKSPIFSSLTCSIIWDQISSTIKISYQYKKKQNFS